MGTPNSNSASSTSFLDTSLESNWNEEIAIIANAPKNPIMAPRRVNPDNLIRFLMLLEGTDYLFSYILLTPAIRPNLHGSLYTSIQAYRSPRATLRAASNPHFIRRFDDIFHTDVKSDP